MERGGPYAKHPVPSSVLGDFAAYLLCDPSQVTCILWSMASLAR